MSSSQERTDGARSLLVADYGNYTHVIGQGVQPKPDMKSAMGDNQDCGNLTAIEFYQALCHILANHAEIHHYRIKVKQSAIDSDSLWIVKDSENQTLWLNQ